MGSTGAAQKRDAANAPDPEMLKVIAHPLRVQILAAAAWAPISPAEFARKHGCEISKAAYHFRELAKRNYVEQVSTRPVRGAVEHYYKTAIQPVFTDEAWADLPPAIRTSIDVPVYTTLVEQISNAIKSGTMEARADRCFVWTPLLLDLQGWDSVMDKLSRLMEEVGKEREAAANRLAESGEEAIPTTVGLLGFQSPTPDRGEQQGPQ